MSIADENLPPVARGPYWQELKVGAKVRTHRRTITETDLVNFISCTGMLESVFVDATHGGVMSGRPVPAALTYGLIEGMLFQSLIQGVGLALLDVSIKAIAPVRVGDSIWATVETQGIRPTSRHNRAIVTSFVTVMNQNNETVLTYAVTRMQSGDPALG